MIDFFKRDIAITKDGSNTLKLSGLDECYHSVNGAYNESMHIFIKSGLLTISNDLSEIDILEVGFGTGLNALLTFEQTFEIKKQINYSAIEPYPLTINEIDSLNYSNFSRIKNAKECYSQIHSCENDKIFKVSEYFSIIKKEILIQNAKLLAESYDLVYFDAFAPDIQPELWSEDIFRKLFLSMKNNGVLLTYSCKGTVKRNLVAAGFNIEKLPGPLGKREILRARKNI